MRRDNKKRHCLESVAFFCSSARDIANHGRLLPGTATKMIGLTVIAEVMDKEPTIAEIWTFCLWASAVTFILSIVLSLAGRRTFFVIFPICLFIAYGTVSETWDAYVGPAILIEAGPDYVFQCHLAASCIIMAWIAAGLTVLLIKPRLGGHSFFAKKLCPPS